MQNCVYLLVSQKVEMNKDYAIEKKCTFEKIIFHETDF